MFLKLGLLYGLIALGYVLQKRFPINTKMVSSILLGPALTIFVFGKVALSDLQLQNLNALFLVFASTCIVAVLCFILSKYVWTSPDKKNMTSLMAASVPNTNSGYFGIPIAFIIFTPEVFSHYLVANFGIVIFMLTIGYCFYANTTQNLSRSLTQLFKLPAFYALILGFIISLSRVDIPHYISTPLEFLSDATGILFSIGGMMLIGIGLSQLTLKDICWKTIFWSNAFCFILWPLTVGAVLFIDKTILHWLGEGDDKILWLVSLCPIGVNAVLYATEFNLHPRSAALMVFSSTLIAIPVLSIASVLFLK